MDNVIRIVVGLALIYVLVVAVAYLRQRKMIYFPEGALGEPAAAGVPEMASVTLRTADGLELVAWYAPARDEAPVVVYFHGNAGNIGGRGGKARPYLDAGYGVLLVEYRGYGPNPGTPSEAGLYDDGRAALAFLAEAGVPLSRMVLYGESLGSGVAVQIAQGRAIMALVLEAPFTSLPDVGALHYPYLPVRLLARDTYDSLSKIAGVAAPLIVIHGTDDATVPVHMGLTLLAAANEPKFELVLDGAGHADVNEFGAAEKVIAILDNLPTMAEPR